MVLVHKMIAEGAEGWEEAQKKFRCDCFGRYERREYVNRRGRKCTADVKVEDGKYEPIKGYMLRTIREAEEKLDTDLKHEAERKYDDIIDRTNDIVGEITDAKGLTIDNRLNLNGLVIGTRGTARVDTIAAGGWNIQCFHFRTLIRKI